MAGGVAAGKKWKLGAQDISRLCALFVLGVGGAVIAGWALDVAVLKSVFPRFVSMKANTALMFICAGIGLWLAAGTPARRWNPWLLRACAGVVLGTALLTTVEYAFRVNLGIDEILFRESVDSVATSHPGRMSPITAVCFMLTGAALLGMSMGESHIRAAQFFASVIGVIGFSSIAGYALGAVAVYSPAATTAVALHTAMNFIVLCAGLLFLKPDQGLARAFTDDRIGGVLIRRLAPAVVLLPLAMVWGEVRGRRAHLYSPEIGDFLVMVFSMIALGLLVCWTGASLNRQDARRLDAEQETQRARTFLDSIVKHVPHMIFVKDTKDLRFVMFNRAGEDLLGIPREELIGKSDYDLFAPEQAEFFISKDRQVLKDGRMEDIPEEPINTRNKGVRFLHTRKIPITDPSGEPLYLLGISEDITDWKDAQEALRTSERRLKDILDNATAVIYVKDREGRYLLINRRYESLFHVRLDDVVGKTDYDLFPKERADAFRANDLAVLRARAPLEFEEFAPLDDGLHAYISVKFPLFDAQGETYAMCGVSTDITDWKKAQEAVRISEERYRTLFDNIPVMYFTLDPRGVVLAVNRFGLEHLGYAGDELVGHSVLDIFYPDDRADVAVNLQRCLESPAHVASWQFRKICKDGTTIWVQEAVRAITNAAGETVVLVACEDITERRALEQEIVKISTQEQERIAHDLHDGLGQLLTGLAFKSKVLEHTLQDNAAPPIDNVREIVRLANQASKEARAIARGLDPVVLDEGLAAALQDLAFSTREITGINCRFDAALDAVITDKSRSIHLYRIAQEAVTNAVRHAKPDTITISLATRPGEIMLTVMDDGMGVPPDTKGSSGFGLRNMNYRARAIGGSLSLARNEGGGTTVTCKVRVARTA